MTLVLLLAAGGVGAFVAAWGGARGGRSARVGAVVGALALLAVLMLALVLDASPVDGTDGVSQAGGLLFDGRIVATGYVRLVVALWALDSLLVLAIAWLLGGLAALRGLLPATLAAIVGGTLTLAATSLTLGVLAAAATGLAAMLVVLASNRPKGLATAVRELRVALGTGALLLAAIAVAPLAGALALGDGALDTGEALAGGSGPTGEAGAVLGLVALAAVLAVGIRLGSIPFHLRVPRLTDAVPPAASPLLLAWLPLQVAVVGLAAMDRLVAPLALPLDGERALIIVFALASLSFGALAAFIADDLRHAVGYLVLADGGLVLLGLAAMDPAAWGPTRVWLVALAGSKTALAAWAAVAEARFETRSLPDLRGWLRPAPILAAGLVLVIVATFGLPGWIAFGARGDLARLAAGSPWDAVLVVAGFLALPAYLRLLAVGFGPASSPVARAVPERIVRAPRRVESLPVELEGGPAGEAVGAGEPGAVVVGAGEPGRPASARRRRSGATASLGSRVTEVVRRDRAELTSAAVLALAILAALTSWGALDIGGAAAEPAPIVSGTASD